MRKQRETRIPVYVFNKDELKTIVKIQNELFRRSILRYERRQKAASLIETRMKQMTLVNRFEAEETSIPSLYLRRLKDGDSEALMCRLRRYYEASRFDPWLGAGCRRNIARKLNHPYSKAYHRLFDEALNTWDFDKIERRLRRPSKRKL